MIEEIKNWNYLDYPAFDSKALKAVEEDFYESADYEESIGELVIEDMSDLEEENEGCSYQEHHDVKLKNDENSIDSDKTENTIEHNNTSKNMHTFCQKIDFNGISSLKEPVSSRHTEEMLSLFRAFDSTTGESNTKEILCHLGFSTEENHENEKSVQGTANQEGLLSKKDNNNVFNCHQSNLSKMHPKLRFKHINKEGDLSQPENLHLKNCEGRRLVDVALTSPVKVTNDEIAFKDKLHRSTKQQEDIIKNNKESGVTKELRRIRKKKRDSNGEKPKRLILYLGNMISQAREK